MSDRLLQIGIHPGLHTEAADYITPAFSQNPVRMKQNRLLLAKHIVHTALKTASLFYFSNSSDKWFMIPIILFLSFTSSTATSAKPPAFARCANWLMLLASPASLRMVSASCLFSRGVPLPNDRLPDVLADTQPGFGGSLPDCVEL